jgi:hypothetical protein
MTVVVPHGSTREKAIATMDRVVDQLLTGAGGSSFQVTNKQQSWNGSVMSFSFVGKLGFVSLPIAGTVAVDDVNVTVNIDLPPVVKSFVGEEKVRAIVDENVRAMLAG